MPWFASTVGLKCSSTMSSRMREFGRICSPKNCAS